MNSNLPILVFLNSFDFFVNELSTAMSSSEPVVPDTGTSVDVTALDAEVTPSSLTFGLGSHQAPVGRWIKQTLVVKNRQTCDINVLISPVDDPRISYKCTVVVEHQNPFVLEAGAEEVVEIKMKVLCTTALRMEFLIKTWKNEEFQYKEARLPFETESELSTSLDPAELKFGKKIGRFVRVNSVA